MVIKLYVSRTSGNVLMKVHQEHIKRIFDSKKIPYEEIDIADPQHAKGKEFMQTTLQGNETESVVLPPQLFNDEQYRGDYSGFFEAVENERMYKYLNLEAPPDEVEYQRQQEQLQ